MLDLAHAPRPCFAPTGGLPEKWMPVFGKNHAQSKTSATCLIQLNPKQRLDACSYLDFEKPVAELEAKVEELRALAADRRHRRAIGEEIGRLEAKAAEALADLYATLTPWQKTQVARHPQRPHCLDYIAQLVTSFVPFAGDRKFGDDEAIVGGLRPLLWREHLRDRPRARLDHREPAQAHSSAWRDPRAIARRCG